MIADEGEKWCTGCEQTHPLSEFYADRKTGRLYTACKQHWKAKRRRRDQAIKQELVELRAFVASVRLHNDRSPAGGANTSRAEAPKDHSHGRR